MNAIHAYLESFGSARALAKSLGVADAMVSQWKSGQKRPSPAMASAIERETAGAVRRWDLRPDDWHRIWPELIGAAGAPAIPAEAEDA